jgi:ankyrin repeat protein
LEMFLSTLSSASILTVADADGNTSLHAASMVAEPSRRCELIKLLIKNLKVAGASKKLILAENKVRFFCAYSKSLFTTK